MTKVVIDRFEEDLAVLLVGEENKPMPVDRKTLPAGVKEGDWLQVVIENGLVTHAVLDPQTTSQMAETIAEKMARLRRGDHLK